MSEVTDPCLVHYFIIVIVCVLILFIDRAYRLNMKYLEERNRFLVGVIDRLNEESTYREFQDRMARGEVVNGGKSEIKVEE